MLSSLRIYFFGTLSTSSAVKFHYVGETADISRVEIPKTQQLASTGTALKKKKKRSFLMKHPKKISKKLKTSKTIRQKLLLGRQWAKRMWWISGESCSSRRRLGARFSPLGVHWCIIVVTLFQKFHVAGPWLRAWHIFKICKTLTASRVCNKPSLWWR